ncbi:outer membrane protein assembly factor BamD [Roseibium salinum]|nr:outer membrane protein assembly factor BamD [Roseibium salinum]
MAVLATPILLAACSGKDDLDDLALNDTPPEVLFNEGLALRAQGKLRDSTEKFEELDKLYPYSEYSKKSLVNLAFLNYSRGKYTEAVNAARRFVTLYPGGRGFRLHALHRRAELFPSDAGHHPRSGGDEKKAASAFNELIQRFPESEYVPDAEEKLRIVHDQLGGKEMQVGRYYLNKRNYIAAINRFKTVVLEYQTTRHVEEALFRLTESYYALGVVSEAQTAAAVLGHNYPDSQWYKDAYSLLNKGGYEPSEDSGSWISRAFSSLRT